MTTAPPAAYIHIPFCVSICPYCDFAVCQPTAGLIGAYLDALETEIAACPVPLQPETIYIGGGTPTAMSVTQLERLLKICQPLMTERLREFSIEANPNALTPRKLRLLYTCGVNRLSLGVQTFSEKGLRVLGRQHSADDARRAIARARVVGFENISCDLIFAWPEQTLREWEADLAEAIALKVAHVSAYNLTIEAGTPFHAWQTAGRIAPLSNDVERDFFDLAGTMLNAGGLPRYEISNFADPGAQCLHNLHYWEGASYAAFGVGAHGYLDGTRFANHRSTAEYIRFITETGSARVFSETLNAERRAKECAVFWLRLTAGIDAAGFQARTSVTLEALYAEELPRLLASEMLRWIEIDGTRHLALTAAGLPLADEVMAELVG